jgi:hypothetical protein
MRVPTFYRQSEVDKTVNQISKNITGVQGDVSKLAHHDRLYDRVKQDKYSFRVQLYYCLVYTGVPLKVNDLSLY